MNGILICGLVLAVVERPVTFDGKSHLEYDVHVLAGLDVIRTYGRDNNYAEGQVVQLPVKISTSKSGSIIYRRLDQQQQPNLKAEAASSAAGAK